MTPSGGFIIIEGQDGVGKSTIARALRDALNSLGHKATLTKEPGGTPFGEEIRSLLFRYTDLCPETEILIMQAQRWEHLTKVIKPLVDEGWWVISDRHLDTTYVYQGDNNPTLDTLIANTTPKGLGWVPIVPPNLTLYLDADNATIRERIRDREDINRLDVLDDTTLDQRRHLFARQRLQKAGNHTALCHDTTKSTVSDIVSNTLHQLGVPFREC
jgi:dTMP kinase